MKDVFFSSQEKNGYELFKRNCGTCHNEPMLTNDSFLIMVYLWTPTIKIMEELRLLKILKTVLILECQILKNIEFTYPYMHDGRFKKLKEVINLH